jgi:hypothetical protein
MNSTDTFLERYSDINKEYRTILNNFLKPLQPKIIDKEFVRVGGRHDGGYVMVNNFTKNDYLIGMGVGGDIEFEKHLLPHIAGADLYDGEFEDFSNHLINYNFYTEMVGVENNQTTLHECIKRVDKKYDLILKMDIEESEWKLIDSIEDDILNKFKQIVIEFHLCRKFLLPDRFNIKQYERAIRVFNKINETHYPIHAHLNTYGTMFTGSGQIIPNTFEMTYIRKSEISEYKERTRSSAELLDSPNSSLHSEIFFPYI